MGGDNSKNINNDNPYDKLIDFIINNHHKIKYFNIYNVGTGLINWKLYVKNDNHLNFKLCLLENNKIILSLPLRYSNSSNDYKMILKSKTWSDCVTIELYSDNIHTHRLNNLKLPILPILYGFLTYDGHEPIPIVL